MKPDDQDPETSELQSDCDEMNDPANATEGPNDVRRAYSMSVEAVERSKRTLERSQELLERLGMDVKTQEGA